MKCSKAGTKQTPQVRMQSLQQLVESLMLPITNLEILDQAFTHTSYANEHKDKNLIHNQRLEFLGDAILDLIIGEYLYCTYPTMSEGELTKTRAIIVCEASLAECSKHLNLAHYLLLGKGEDRSGGRERISILADTFEALIGAIYMATSYEIAKEFVLVHLTDYIAQAMKGEVGKDYKTLLQEFVQQDGEKAIHYILCGEEGPDHNKRFRMAVEIDGKTYGSGLGKSKKEAEQQAAKVTLESLY